jgi:hypothetical protein
MFQNKDSDWMTNPPKIATALKKDIKRLSPGALVKHTQKGNKKTKLMIER